VTDQQPDAVTGTVRIAKRPRTRDLQLITRFPADPYKPDRLTATVHFIGDEDTTMRNARLLATCQGMRRVIKAAMACGCLPVELRRESAAIVQFQSSRSNER
jgi:hypothetical protein